MVRKKGNDGFIARDYLSGTVVQYDAESGEVNELVLEKGSEYEQLPFVGPGLVDLQINGVNGVDFNDTSVTVESLLEAAEYLTGKGVTTFFPTVITNSPANICYILSVINEACRINPFFESCIGGIHLEGPFISAEDGYRGAHKKEYVTLPDWNMFSTFQEASGNRVRIVSLAPELDNSVEFIKKCKTEGLVVAIAHSAANREQIEVAAEAGVTLSTHLGNSVPVMLRRHPNIIWDQLADERLNASIIADGFHLPDSFISVVLKAKQDKALLVSDATYFSGFKPGEYDTHIGEKVVLEGSGRLSMKGQNGLLAGATELLPGNVQYLVKNKLAGLPQAWDMASTIPCRVAGGWLDRHYRESLDMVLFSEEGGDIVISDVYKRGDLVFYEGKSA